MSASHSGHFIHGGKKDAETQFGHRQDKKLSPCRDANQDSFVQPVALYPLSAPKQGPTECVSLLHTFHLAITDRLKWGMAARLKLQVKERQTHR